MTDLLQAQLMIDPHAQVRCRVCTAAPAAEATFYKHTGRVFAMRTRSDAGPFCGNCGLAVFRDLTEHTLVLGWWGLLSFFITPVVIGYNVVQRRRIARLAEPVGADGYLYPEPPLYRRPAILGALVPLIVVAALAGVLAVPRHPSTSLVGKCVNLDPGLPVDVVGCRSHHDGVVSKIVDLPSECPADSIGAFRFTGADPKVYCLARG